MNVFIKIAQELYEAQREYRPEEISFQSYIRNYLALLNAVENMNENLNIIDRNYNKKSGIQFNPNMFSENNPDSLVSHYNKIINYIRNNYQSDFNKNNNLSFPENRKLYIIEQQLSNIDAIAGSIQRSLQVVQEYSEQKKIDKVRSDMFQEQLIYYGPKENITFSDPDALYTKQKPRLNQIIDSLNFEASKVGEIASPLATLPREKRDVFIKDILNKINKGSINFLKKSYSLVMEVQKLREQNKASNVGDIEKMTYPSKQILGKIRSFVSEQEFKTMDNLVKSYEFIYSIKN